MCADAIGSLGRNHTASTRGRLLRPGPPWPPRGGGRRHRTRRAATPPPRTKPRSPGGTTAALLEAARAATRAPAPPGAGRHADVVAATGRPTSRTARRRAGRSRPAAGTARSRRRPRGLIALCGQGEESPLQAQGHLAAVAVRAGCAVVELSEGLGQVGAGLGQRAATPRIAAMPAGRPRPPRRTARPARSGRRPAASPGRRPTADQGIGHLGVQPAAHTGAPTRRRPRAATRGETASCRFPTARAPARPRARR